MRKLSLATHCGKSSIGLLSNASPASIILCLHGAVRQTQTILACEKCNYGFVTANKDIRFVLRLT